MDKKLNKRDEDTLNFIKGFMLENNVTPTIRDICSGLNISSVSAVYYRFKKLVDLGYVIPFGDNTIRYSVKGLKYKEDRRGTKTVNKS